METKPKRQPLPGLSTLDLEALKALVLAQQAELASRETEIEHLRLLILKLKRMQFGRKSEKLDRQIDQLELRLEDLESNPPASAPAQPIVAQTPEATPTSQSVVLCRSSCRARTETYAPKHEATCPPLAAARCVRWVKMFPKRWNTCPDTSR